MEKFANSRWKNVKLAVRQGSSRADCNARVINSSYFFVIINIIIINMITIMFFRGRKCLSAEKRNIDTETAL